MKTLNAVIKILTALATIVGAIYLIATYGDKIVAWAKDMMAGCPCCGGEEEAVEEEAEAVEEAPAEEAPAEETAPAEEAPVEEAVEEAAAEEEAPVEEATPVANEEDFEA